MKNLTLPISFEEVSYFRNSFRGDLIVTQGVIYYFPHTNVFNANEKTRFLYLVEMFGIGGVPITFLIEGFRMTVRTTINRSRLRKLGLWVDGDSNELLQSRLDAYVKELREQSPSLVRYEYTLPKPLRFAKSEIKNLSTKGGLRFDTEFDQHDFRIAFRRKKLLREALWLGGFLQQNNRT